ncbi:MAG: hypothetical protein M3442_09150, partial [Chloroflexota bacterium]|nr:hypothetical protein [Chloroflexota bacterium]
WFLLDPDTDFQPLIRALSEDHDKALLIANLGLFGFIGGGLIGDRALFNRTLFNRSSFTKETTRPTPALPSLHITYSLVRTVGWVLIAGSFLSQIFFYSNPIVQISSSSATAVIAATGSASTSINSTTPAFITAFTNLLVGVMMVFISYTGLKSWHLLVLALYFSLRLYSGWGRFTVLLGVWAVALAVISARNSRWLRPREGLALGGALVLFLSGKGLGQLLFNGRWQEALDAVSDGTSGLRTGEADFFWNYDFLVGTVMVVPRFLDYTLARFYLVPAWFWIPRALWEGKPVFWFPSAYVDRVIDFNGFTVNFVGEAYISGGLLGVALIPALFGYFLARLHASGWVAAPASGRRILSLAVITVLPQLYRDGFSGLWLFFLYYGSPYGLMWLTARVNERWLPFSRGALSTGSTAPGSPRALGARRTGSPGHTRGGMP